MQNAFIESFNGSFRDECLNETLFSSLVQARAAITAWKEDDNRNRPHSSLGNITPSEFAFKMARKNRPHEARLKTQDSPENWRERGSQVIRFTWRRQVGRRGDGLHGE